jgi:hypothetical protein
VLNINALISELCPHLELLLIALQPPLAAVEVANSIDELALLHSLKSLLNQLRNSDMAATNTSVQLQEKFGAALGEQWESLSVAMINLDFAQAADGVLALIKAIQANQVLGND